MSNLKATGRKLDVIDASMIFYQINFSLLKRTQSMNPPFTQSHIRKVMTFCCEYFGCGVHFVLNK